MILLFLLALLGFALLGFGVTLKVIFGKKVPRLDPLAPPLPGDEVTPDGANSQQAPAFLSRRQKLEVVEELLGDDMPEALAAELAHLRVPPEPSPPEPIDLTDTGQVSPPEAPEPDPHDSIDLADAGFGVALPVDAGRLPVHPDLAHLPEATRPGLGALLSFENIIFLLSAVLILGGTLYFAAVTWGQVPGGWQYFFVELVILVYGGFMLAGAWALRWRLRLDKASLVLDSTAAAVAPIAAAIAAAAFFQSSLAGVLGCLGVAGFAWASLRRVLAGVDPDSRAAPFFAASVALLGLSGAAAARSQSAVAGALALLATLLCLWVLVGFASRRPWPLWLLCLAITATALLLSMPGHVKLAHVAPTLVALSWCAAALRRDRRPGMALVALAGVALGIGFSSGSAGALAVSALFGSLVLLRASSPLPDSRDQPQVDSFALAAAIAAALLWVLLSILWAPAIGLLLPASSIAWLIDLVTQPGQQVAASWDGLAALPSLVLALVLAERLRLRDDRRHLIVELAGLGTLVLSLGLTALTFARQPLASGVIVLLLAGTWAFWSARRASAWRMAVAELAVLFGVASLGYSHSASGAWLSVSLAALALAALPSCSGRWVATATLPLLWLGIVDEAHAPIGWVVSLPLALGGLQLWQRGARAQAWLRPFAPANFLLAWLGLLYYQVNYAPPLANDDWLAPSLVAALLVASAWVLWRRGPRFLRVELRVLAGLIALFSTLYALDLGPGHHDTWLNGGSAVAALLSLLLVTRGAWPRSRRLSWALAMLALPIPAASLIDAPFAWPGAAVASLALALLLWRSRREQSPWMAGLGLSYLLVAALWWTLALARLFSTGGGEERVLTALATVCVLAGAFVVLLGSRVSAATPAQLRRFATGYLGLALCLGLSGMVWVDAPGGFDQILALGNLVAVGSFAWMLALRHRRGWLLYLAEASVVGVYAYLRGRSDLLDGLRACDGLVLAAGALGFVALSQLLQRRKAALGVDQSRRFAAALPLLVPFVLEWDGQLSESGGLALASAVYGWLARRQNSPRFAWLAAAGVNLMLLPLWIRFNVHSSIAYAAPLGLTLMFMARVYRQQLQQAGPALRSVAALLLLGSSSLESFAFASVWPALLLGLLSIGAVLLGLVWRQRAYLYAGFGFLLVDMVVNLSRWGMQSRLIAGSLGVLAGVALFALGVVVAKRKQALLAHYQRVQRWQW